MAVRIRRSTLAAIVLPVLLLAMAGLARANTILVNTLDSGSQLAPLCTLEDAVTAANSQAPVNGCAGGTGFNDTIQFLVTGTIFLEDTLIIASTESLEINGPPFGGITIDGGGTLELIDAEDTSLGLENLTLADGSNDAGGALFSGGSEIGIFNCTFLNNGAAEGGAIFVVESLMDIVNCTFTGNSAFIGGAVLVEEAEVGITNCTFSGNGAEDGADIVTEIGGSFVNNSIFANSLSGGNCDGIGDFGYNISDDNSCGFSGTSVNNSTTLNLDPLGLQNNGGPTQTIALESGSQAIDFVPIKDCIDGFDEPVATDQRLFTRPDPGNLNFCDTGAYEFGAVAPIVLAPKSERLQIARGSAANSDMVNTAFTFIYNGDPDCDISTGGDEDALNSGVGVAVFGGTCANLPASGLILYLDPFVVHSVNHQQYGTLFQSFGPETVSARMVALPPPTGACGAWTLNLEVAGLDTAGLGLGGNGPFALVVSDLHGDLMDVGLEQALNLSEIEGDATECFDITNAIVGNQIPKPGHRVRRGARR